MSSAETVPALEARGLCRSFGEGVSAVNALRGEVFGFIFQFFNLLPTLTAAENVLLPALVAGEPPSRYARRTDELLSPRPRAGRARNSAALRYE